MHSPTDQLTQDLSGRMAQTFHQIPHDVATGVLYGTHLALGLPLPDQTLKGLPQCIAHAAAHRIQALVTEMSNELRDDVLLIFADLSDSESTAQNWMEPQIAQVLPHLATETEEPPNEEHIAINEEQNKEQVDVDLTPHAHYSATGTTTNGRVVRFLLRHNWLEISGANGHRVFRHGSGHRVAIGKNPSKEMKRGTQSTLFQQIGNAMGGKMFLNGSKIDFMSFTEHQDSPRQQIA